jgi:nitrogen fixation/metabolism regulation signal transduction histidine kinase
VFEPYVTTKATGTGLGLAIARKIAIEHGGELALATERAPTGGARFIITLPLRGPESSLA